MLFRFLHFHRQSSNRQHRSGSMAARSLWLACVFLAVFAIFAIIETSAWNETRASEDYEGLKTYDVKTKGKELKLKKSNESIEGKDAVNTARAKAKPIPKKYRIVLMRTRAKSPEDEEHRLPVEKITEKIGESGERYKDRAKRNATVVKESKDAKKSEKKLKLAQSRAGYKNWKNKERPSDSGKDKSLDKAQKKISRRRVDYPVDGEYRSGRSKRYAVSRNFKDEKYYAQRKAVMDRFYARQKEIAEKYARKLSTTPKYVFRYDASGETEQKNVSSPIKTTIGNIEETGNAISGRFNDLGTSTTTIPATEDQQIEETVTVASRDRSSNRVQIAENLSEDNIEEDESDDYDYYMLGDNKYNKATEATFDENDTMNDGMWDADNNSMEKWGDCSGNLVYVHDLAIGSQNGLIAGANVMTLLEVPYCVTCVVVPINKRKATVDIKVSRNNDEHYTKVVLTIGSFRDDKLNLIVKMWGVGKSNGSCDHA